MTDRRTADERISAQPAMEPGTEGYWKVWGARVADVRPGDLVMLKYSDEPGTVFSYVVGERVRRPEYQGRPVLMDTVRPKFSDQVTGEEFTIGAMQPIVLLRWGTHNTLADSVR